MSFLERITNIEKNEIENNFKPMILNILEDIVGKSIDNLSNNNYVISELIIKKMYNARINIAIETIHNSKNIRLTCNQASSIVLIDNKNLPFDALSHVIDILQNNIKDIIEKYLHKYFAGMKFECNDVKNYLEHPEHAVKLIYAIKSS